MYWHTFLLSPFSYSYILLGINSKLAKKIRSFGDKKFGHDRPGVREINILRMPCAICVKHGIRFDGRNCKKHTLCQDNKKYDIIFKDKK